MPNGKDDDRDKKLRNRLLQPPKLTAAADGPLKAEQIGADNFDLGYRLGPIYDILRHPRTETPLAVAIYGDWGSGKTSAMRWLEERLKDWNAHVKNLPKSERNDATSIVPVWFYPWKYQEREDVWRGLVAEVILACLGRNTTKKKVKSEAKALLGFMGKGFLRLLSGVKVQVGAGAAKTTVDLNSVLKGLSEETADYLHPEADYLNQFESALGGWLNSYLGKSERMVVFIDDLDRCLPEVALQVLEALKLYLNMENLVFVVGVDRSVVNQLVAGHYKKLELEEEKSRDYLAKMFQVEVTVAPSEGEIGEFLDGVLSGIDTWNELDDEVRDIFRGVFLNLAKRSPREVKRLINSALITGVGVEMSSRTYDGAAQAPTIAQGIQVELIQRILRDRYTRETVLGSRSGNVFFDEWSRSVREHPGEDAAFAIPSAILQRIRDASADPTRRQKGDETPSGIASALSEIPPHLRGLVAKRGSHPFLELIADEDLGALMRIEFSAEAAQMERAGGSPEAQRIVDEAVARAVSKSIDEITQEDRVSVAELGLNETDLDDLRPLARLANLQSLSLNGTQVADIAPLAGLQNLQTLWLNRTEVAEEQKEALKKAVPGLTIHG